MTSRVVAALALSVLAACGAAEPYRVVRRLGGERRQGQFVSPHSYEWFIRGELALAHGDLDGAAEAFELARAGPEEDPLVLSRLVEVLDRLDRREEADEVLAGALETFPESESLWLAKGRIAERRGDASQAIAAYERAEAAAPRSELAPLALATLLSSREATGRADAVLARFLRRAPDGSPEALRARLRLALLRDDIPTATRTVRALLRVAPARADEVQEVARAALGQGRPVLAAALLDAMPRGLSDPALHVEALTGSGRFDRAEAILSSTPPSALGGRSGEALLYLRAGMPERAGELAEMALLTEPEPRAWLASGLAELALGRWAEAAERLARVPAGTRGFAEARMGLSAALRARGLDALAAEVIAAALRGPVDDEAALREALAAARLGAGDVEGALAALEPLRGAVGEAARGRILDEAGRASDAAAAWAAVPPDAPGLDARSRARARAERLLANDRRSEAITVLEQWVEMAPEDGVASERLAEIRRE